MNRNEIVKILFVCHGNICRSPMAEFIMKNIVKKNNLEKSFFIASSATSSEEIFMGVGNPIYPPAKEALNRHGIPFENHRATLLKKSDYNDFDFLIAMDKNNIRNIKKIIGYDEKSKVFKLLDFCKNGENVSDPWYSNDFETAFFDIERGCNALFEKLSKNL